MRQFITLIAFLCCARTLFGACGATTYTPNRSEDPFCQTPEFATNPSTHQAMYLTDPSGEQTAIVDLEWGGVLVSLNYNGKELFWGNDTGATVQPAMFHGASYTYNPQQAGDWGERTPGNYSRGAPLYGAACKNDSQLVLYTAALDDAQDNRGFYGRAAGIRGEQVGTKMWFTPYAFTTYISFVPSGNPYTGNPTVDGPRYYLKMEQAVLNTDSTEGNNCQKVFGFGYEMAMYMRGATAPTHEDWGDFCSIDVASKDGSFRYADFLFGDCATVPCPRTDLAAQTKMMTGGYSDPEHTEGVASMTNPSLMFAGDPQLQGASIGAPEFDSFWNNSAVHASFSFVTIPPLQGKNYVYYFLAGPSARAKAFNP